MKSADELLEALCNVCTVGAFHDLLRVSELLASDVGSAFRGMLEDGASGDDARTAAGYRVALTLFKNMTNLPDDADRRWRNAGQELASVTLEVLPASAGMEPSVEMALGLASTHLEDFGASGAAPDLERALKALVAAGRRCRGKIAPPLRRAVWDTLVDMTSRSELDPTPYIHQALTLRAPSAARARLLVRLARLSLGVDDPNVNFPEMLESNEGEDRVIRAVDLYERALACIRKHAQRELWTEIAGGLGLLILLAGDSSDPARGESLLAEAVDFYASDPPRRDLQFPLQAGLAEAQALQDRFCDAIETMRKALAVAADLNVPAEELISRQTQLANWHEDLSDFDEALVWYQSAATTLCETRWASGNYRSPSHQTEAFHSIYRGLTRCLLEHGLAVEAFDAAACGRSRSMNERLAYRKHPPIEGIPAGLWQRAQHARDTFAVARDDGTHADLALLERELEDAISHLRDVSPAAARLIELSPLQAEDVSRHLKPDQALLVLYPTRKDVRAFVARPSRGTPQVSSLLLASSEMGKLVSETLKSWVVTYEAYRNGKMPVEAICDALDRAISFLEERLDLEALAGALDDRIKHLLIVAHHPFTASPLHLMRLPDGRRLLDRFLVSFVPSIASIVRPRPRPIGRATKLLGVIDPRPRGRWRLEYASFEAASIAAGFDHPTFLPGDAATWEAVRNGLLKSRAAHLSCHCTHSFTREGGGHLFLAQDEIASYVHILADLGAISSYEREETREILRKAGGSWARLAGDRREEPDFDLDLLVLSACESGLAGMMSYGDEYVTLPSAFHIAGARAVVATLWRVGDRGCLFLFDRFYQELVSKCLHPVAALGAAQRWLADASGDELAAVAERLVLARGDQPGSATLRAWAERQRRPVRRAGRPYCHPFFWGAFYHLGA